MIQLPKKLIPATFAFTATVGVLTILATIAAATKHYDVATLIAAFVAVALAGAQTRIMSRQTHMMEKQDELLRRLASLEAFGNTISDSGPSDGFEQAYLRAHGSTSGLTTQIYLINTGLRAASGFTVSVQIDGEPFVRRKSQPWQSYGMDTHTLLIFESEARVFPGDFYILTPLALIQPANGSAPQIGKIRIAFEDGETGWLPLRDYRELPEEFKQRLAGQVVANQAPISYSV